MKGYEKAVEFLSTILLIVVGALGIFVAVLDFIGTDFETGPWKWLKGPLPVTILIVALLALALGLERLVRFQQVNRKLDNLAETITRLEGQVGAAGVEVLDAKWAFPKHIAQKARAAQRFILDTNLNQEVRRASTTHPQDEYRRIRNERVLRGELAFRRVEIIFLREHFESVIRRLIMFEGCEFYLRHYDPPPQAIPTLHLMSFDDEHFYIGGFYPSEPSTEEQAAYIYSRELNKLLHEYWQLLWIRAKPLNAGRAINWAELKRIGSRFHINDDEFESLVARLRDEVQRERRRG